MFNADLRVIQIWDSFVNPGESGERRRCMKARILVALAVLSILIGFTYGESHAATYIGYIIQVNVANDGTIYIAVDEQSDANWTGGRWFIASGDHANKLLATAMLALSNNYLIGVDLNSTAQWSVIQSFAVASQ
jgi:hypothetical protein